MSDCVFCKIVSGEIPSPRVYEDDEVIAINDLHSTNPCPHHSQETHGKYRYGAGGTGGSCKENPAGSNKKTWNC